MEDRVDASTARRPGPAFVALAVILVTTAVWWALALWPAGDLPPEWLVRTRAVCFGSRAGGPPDFGGWLFLLGEPLGLIAVLSVIGGGSLARDLATMRHWLRSHRRVRAVAAAGLLAGLTPVVWLALRPGREPSARFMADGAEAIDLPMPATLLVDQHGTRIALGALNAPAILTVAFAHCASVCPTTVHDVMSARLTAGRPAMPLFIVTVDPWRDTAERLPTMAAEWDLAATDHVLSGDVATVERTLDELGIGRERDPNTGDITHAVVVLLIDGRGRITRRLTGDTRGLATLLAAAR